MRRVAGPLCRAWQAVRSDRGSNVVELAVLAPALMMLCMLIVQFGLWFNARQAALAAAQAGAQVARQEAAVSPGRWQADARSAATSYYRGLNTTLMGKLSTRAYGDARTDVYVTVSGPLGYSVFPFFGLHLTVSATAGGPVECFRPANLNGAC